MQESNEKHARGKVFIYIPRSDREVLVQHHAFGLPKLVAFQLRKRECTGLPFSELGKLSFFLYHLCDEELGLCPPCQRLQS